MVKAQVSVRIVPDQDLETVAGALRKYLEDSFAEMKSSNKLNVRIDSSLSTIYSVSANCNIIGYG